MQGQPIQAVSQLKSVGWRPPIGAFCLHSSNEPSELSQWLAMMTALNIGVIIAVVVVYGTQIDI